MTLDSSTLLRQSDGVLAADIDGEIAAINIEGGQYYGLDSIGSAIWRALAEPMTGAALSAKMVDSFDGDPVVIAAETDAFVETLVARGLVIAG